MFNLAQVSTIANIVVLKHTGYMSSILPQVLFALIVASAGTVFNRNIARISENINLGQPITRNDNPITRFYTMALVALGQSKMVTRPIAAVLHIFIYVGFLVINAEVLEIMLDGLTGQHRILSGVMGPLYDVLTFKAEFFMILVLIACFGFLARRNITKLPRFEGIEMTRWPKLDANIILWTEVILIFALLIMNATDQVLQTRGIAGYPQVGTFPISGILSGAFTGLESSTLVVVERTAWWLHLLGILTFLNYIPFSKHFHIIMAFPNTYFSNLEPKGKFKVNEAIKQEVLSMMNPQALEGVEEVPPPARFGAKDVQDLTWKNLMDAYTCTECGRCTSNCPANITGKLLSPRKIMMDTRDRLHEVGKNIEKNNGVFVDDGKSLLDDYISREELWACTSCNACVQACPVNIDPLSIILQMRQYLVMEESAAPEALIAMFSNVENNGAPWAMSSADRFNWANELQNS